MRKILVIIMVLLTSSTMIFAQIVDSPEFEITYNPNPDDDVEFGEVYELPSGDYLLIFDIWPDWATQVHIRSSNYIQGLMKISPTGEILSQKTYPVVGYSVSRPYVIQNNNGEIILVGSQKPWRGDVTSPYYDPLVHDAKIYFKKIDNDLNVTFLKEYSIELDTTPGYSSPKQDAYLSMFSAFPEEDGIWTALIKGVPVSYPLPGTLGNDSLLFYKFDYDGNKIDSNYLELYGANNSGFYRYSGTASKENYTYFTDMISRSRLRMQIFDESFNLTEQINYSSSNPDVYTQLSTKAMSNGNFLVAAQYDNTTITDKFLRIALTEFDKSLNIHNQVIMKADNPLSFVYSPYSLAVDYIDENRIFWVYNDNDDLYGYYESDTWVYINLLTADLQVEQHLFYDPKGEDSHVRINFIKATSDGGLILTGSLHNFTYSPEYFNGFMAKFPPEAFLSIEDAHANGLKTAIAYPNPGNNTLNIRTSLKDAVVEVYDIQGRMVYNRDITDNITSVSTESWNSGMYLWRVVKDGKECESGKWVKD